MEIADEHVRRTFLPDIPTPESTLQFSPNGSELQFSKILIYLNRELELTTPARTRTRTGTELSVQFCQFGPNRRFGTELRQHY